MHIDEDINFNLNPGDVGGLFPGSYNVIPVEPHELTADEYKAQLRNYELRSMSIPIFHKNFFGGKEGRLYFCAVIIQ